MVSFADRASVPSQVLVRFLEGESVLLNLETERYFGLDCTGTRMWKAVTVAPDIKTAILRPVRRKTRQPPLSATR